MFSAPSDVARHGARRIRPDTDGVESVGTCFERASTSTATSRTSWAPAHDVVALLQYEDHRNAILVEHSYGGMVITGAMEAACRIEWTSCVPGREAPQARAVVGRCRRSVLAAARSNSQVVDGTEPIFDEVAGDKASVSRAIGQLLPQLVIAARTRSRDSCNAVSGNPTRCTPGRPGHSMSASISTISPSSPPPHRHREPSYPAPSSDRPQVGDLRIALSSDAHSDDVDSHRGPAAFLTGEPQPRQPTQSPTCRVTACSTPPKTSLMASSPRRRPRCERRSRPQ